MSVLNEVMVKVNDIYSNAINNLNDQLQVKKYILYLFVVLFAYRTRLLVIFVNIPNPINGVSALKCVYKSFSNVNGGF